MTPDNKPMYRFTIYLKSGNKIEIEAESLVHANGEVCSRGEYCGDNKLVSARTDDIEAITSQAI